MTSTTTDTAQAVRLLRDSLPAMREHMSADAFAVHMRLVEELIRRHLPNRLEVVR